MASGTTHDSKAYIASGYDAIADAYLTWAKSDGVGIRHRLELTELLLAQISTTSGDKLKVLELGCGAGDPVTLALAADEKVARVEANDISKTQLEMLGASLIKLDDTASGKVTCHHGDMLQLNFPEQSLDAVLAFYSIIHLPQEEQVQMMGHIHKWLKPGTGHFLACFGAEESTGTTIDNWMGMRSFWASHGVEKSLGMIDNAGFEVVFQSMNQMKGDASFLWVIGKRKSV